MLRITRATLEQAPLVRRIMLDAFEQYLGVLDPPSSAHGETLEDVRRVMEEGGALLAWEDDAAVGCLRFQRKPDYLRVGRVSVLPAYRQRGIATAMMRAVEPIALEMGYTCIHMGVRLILQSNVLFYEGLGYQVVDKHVHPKGRALVVEMEKRLDQGS